MEQQYCSRFHQTVHLKQSEEELEDDQGGGLGGVSFLPECEESRVCLSGPDSTLQADRRVMGSLG